MWSIARMTPFMGAQGLEFGPNSDRGGLARARVLRAEGGDRPTDLLLPRFDEMVDEAPDAIILIDAAGSIAYANRCVTQLLGLERAAILGQGIETWIPGFNRAWRAECREACELGQHFRPTSNGRMTLTGHRADGREFSVDIHFAPLERDGQYWTLVVIRDTTEQRRIVEEAHAARRVAEEMARVKGEFLSFAAHDLSQPVQTLELMLAAFEQGVRPRSELSELSARATISLARMRELLKMLLEISRIESGTLQIHKQPVQIAEIYEYLERQFGPVARAKALTFVTEPCAHIIEADPALLRGLLSNLLANAIHYTPGGEVRLHSVTGRDGTLRIEVQDTGIGIPSEHLQTIFEDFRRLEAAERAHGGGFGLGLGIVRRLSKLLEFPVTVQSTVGRGSTFGVEIPPAKVFSVA